LADAVQAQSISFDLGTGPSATGQILRTVLLITS
jgi:hypothetical protein